jgi:hypothetical protein
MKNKKLIYILLPLVIIVWGAIVYKIMANYLEDDSFDIISEKDDATSLKINNVDTFSLLLNYSDPFLKEGVLATTTQATDYSQTIPVKQSTTSIKEKKDNTPVTWPVVVYCGLIKNKESNKSCSIFKICGTEHIMNAGDTYSDVTLLLVYKDSAIVQYKNIKKTIFK